MLRQSNGSSGVNSCSWSSFSCAVRVHACCWQGKRTRGRGEEGRRQADNIRRRPQEDHYRSVVRLVVSRKAVLLRQSICPSTRQEIITTNLSCPRLLGGLQDAQDVCHLLCARMFACVWCVGVCVGVCVCWRVSVRVRACLLCMYACVWVRLRMRACVTAARLASVRHTTRDVTSALLAWLSKCR